MRFDRTEARLARDLAEGFATRGAQVVVEHRGARVLELAVGDAGTGDALRPDHLVRAYCAIKPVTAVAVAGLVDAGELDLDEPLEPWLPRVAGLAGGVTLAHVLTHTAGLHLLVGEEMELVAPPRRRALVEAARRPPGWRIGVDAAYSEYAAWHVLGWSVEAVTGAPLREHLRDAVLDPIGLADTFVGMTDATYDEVRSRIGVNVDLRQQRGYPMLVERGRRMCTETNPAHGGYTNAADLARWYGALLERRAGADPPALASPATITRFTSEARPPADDLVLGRRCPFGLGFMTSLDAHLFGDRCGPDSFGHSGYVGSTFGFADPDAEIAVGVVYVGIVSHEAAFLRRRALLGALYSDLADADADADADAEAATVAEERPRRWWRRRPGAGAPR